MGGRWSVVPRHRYINFAVLRPPMHPFCGVTATDASILRCYCHRFLHFAVIRSLMPPFCGGTTTDASILRCCGHRYLNFAVLRPPMPSFCCVTATDASILRCSCPRLVVTPVAVHGRRISRQASGKHSLSPAPPTIYHSGVLCRKQAVSIRPVPQASQNNSIRSLSLRDLALFVRRCPSHFSRSLFFVPVSTPLLAQFFGPVTRSLFLAFLRTLISLRYLWMCVCVSLHISI